MWSVWKKHHQLSFDAIFHASQIGTERSIWTSAILTHRMAADTRCMIAKMKIKLESKLQIQCVLPWLLYDKGRGECKLEDFLILPDQRRC